VKEKIIERGSWSFKNLPNSWSWCKFVDVCINVTDNKRKLQQKDYERTGLYPVIDQGAEFISGYSNDDGLLHQMTPPFIIFGDHTKCLKYVDFHFIQGADGVKVLVVPHFNSKFVYWALNAIRLPDKGYSRHFRFLKESFVPIAPMQEQHRIVSKIEELFSLLNAGINALERAKANLKRYRASILKAAVEGKLTEEWRAKNPPREPAPKLLERTLTERRRKWEEEQLKKFADKGQTPPKGWRDKYKEPVKPDTTNLPTLPEDWCWATIDQIAFYLHNGLSKKPNQVPPGYRILRINAVRPMYVNLNEVRYYDYPNDDIKSFFIEDGDLLFTRYNGSIELLGVCGMVRNCIHPTLHPDKLIRIKVLLGYPISSYVEFASNNGFSRKHMVSRARTTAGQTGISGTDIREMPIPFCPLNEQKQILEIITERLSLVSNIEELIDKSIQRSSRLRQAILKRAFEGKLIPQDPNDEPASVHLEKIRAERKSNVDKKSKKPPRKKAGTA